jgi:hypothetical protein
MTGSLPACFLRLLAKHGLWKQNRILAYATHIPIATQRSEAFTSIFRFLDVASRTEVLRLLIHAIQVLRGVPLSFFQQSAWSSFLETNSDLLGPEDLEQIISEVVQITDVKSRLIVLNHLAICKLKPDMVERLWDTALEVSGPSGEHISAVADRYHIWLLQWELLGALCIHKWKDPGIYIRESLASTAFSAGYCGTPPFRSWAEADKICRC